MTKREIHPLLAEYKALARELIDEDECQCVLCERIREIETEISTALECAPLVADVRAAVAAANAAYDQISEAVAQRPTWAITEKHNGE